MTYLLKNKESIKKIKKSYQQEGENCIAVNKIGFSK